MLSYIVLSMFIFFKHAMMYLCKMIHDKYMKLVKIWLYFIELHYIALHYITVHSILLLYIMLNYFTLQNAILQSTKLHYIISYEKILHYIKLR